MIWLHTQCTFPYIHGKYRLSKNTTNWSLLIREASSMQKFSRSGFKLTCRVCETKRGKISTSVGSGVSLLNIDVVVDRGHPGRFAVCRSRIYYVVESGIALAVFPNTSCDVLETRVEGWNSYYSEGMARRPLQQKGWCRFSSSSTKNGACPTTKAAC